MASKRTLDSSSEGKRIKRAGNSCLGGRPIEGPAKQNRSRIREHSVTLTRNEVTRLIEFTVPARVVSNDLSSRHITITTLGWFPAIRVISLRCGA